MAYEDEVEKILEFNDDPISKLLSEQGFDDEGDVEVQDLLRARQGKKLEDEEDFDYSAYGLDDDEPVPGEEIGLEDEEDEVEERTDLQYDMDGWPRVSPGRSPSDLGNVMQPLLWDPERSPPLRSNPKPIDNKGNPTKPWTVHEVLAAAKQMMNKYLHTGSGGYLTPFYDRETAIGVGLDGLINAVKNDKGKSPFGRYLWQNLRSAIKRGASAAETGGGLTGVPKSKGGVEDPFALAKKLRSADIEAQGEEGAGATFASQIESPHEKGDVETERSEMMRKLGSMILSDPEVGLNEKEEQVIRRMMEVGFDPSALQTATGGKHAFDEDDVRAALDDPSIGLTDKQKFALDLQSRGASWAQIADAMHEAGLSPSPGQAGRKNASNLVKAAKKKIQKYYEANPPESGQVQSLEDAYNSALNKMREYLSKKGVTSPEAGFEKFGIEEALAIAGAIMIVECHQAILETKLELMAEEFTINLEVGNNKLIEFLVTEDLDVIEARDEYDDMVLHEMPESAIEESKRIAQVMMSPEYISEMTQQVVGLKAQPVLAVVNSYVSPEQLEQLTEEGECDEEPMEKEGSLEEDINIAMSSGLITASQAIKMLAENGMDWDEASSIVKSLL